MSKIYLLLLSLCLISCTPQNANFNLSKSQFKINSTNKEALKNSLQQSIKYFSRNPSQNFNFNDQIISYKSYAKSLKNLLEKIISLDSNELVRWIKKNFNLYVANQDVLFTGYYRSYLKGSREKIAPYHYPIYNRPKDLITFIPNNFVQFKDHSRPIFIRLEGHKALPYYTREEIDGFGILRNKNLEIAWVSDPIEAFFLHIQGSGVIQLENNEKIEVGYAASNSQPYSSIGNWLIARRGYSVKDINKQVIVEYLKNNPEDLASMLFSNPSYVFFEERAGGAFGSLGLPLSANHSVASDPNYYPKGALMLINYLNPLTSERTSSLVLNQDTGGAIRGLNRLDIYYGEGVAAESSAGRQKSLGEAFVLIPK